MADNTSANQPIEYDDDLKLIQSMAAGNVSALDELYAKHGSAILGFLIARLSERQLAEEILQDVMLAAWKYAASFRAESSVRTWLLTIARNRAINARRRSTPTLVSFGDTYDPPSLDTGPVEQMERESERTVVRHALDKLPDTHREILVLVFYQQLTGPEIAEVLDISIGTVKSRLHRAKESLRRVLHYEGRPADA
jgi:RNA polymerase sigma-70 factor (ECF subfamily)